MSAIRGSRHVFLTMRTKQVIALLSVLHLRFSRVARSIAKIIIFARLDLELFTTSNNCQVNLPIMRIKIRIIGKLT